MLPLIRVRDRDDTSLVAETKAIRNVCWRQCCWTASTTQRRQAASWIPEVRVGFSGHPGAGVATANRSHTARTGVSWRNAPGSSFRSVQDTTEGAEESRRPSREKTGGFENSAADSDEHAIRQLVKPRNLGGSTPPGAGDIAIVNNAVRITSDTTIGDGSDSTVLDVTNGSLTIMGATLTIRGRSTFGKYNSGVTVGRLTVRSTSAVPGGIILDGDSGASPVMYVDNDTGLWFSGTSAVRCFVRTPRTTTGKPGRIADKGTLRCFFLSASYTDFSRLGDASNPGLQARYVGTSNLSNPPFIMDHCTVDSSGQLPYLGVADGAVNFQLTNSTWTNGQSNTGYVLEATASGVISGGGTRKIDSCLFFCTRFPFTRRVHNHQ